MRGRLTRVSDPTVPVSPVARRSSP
jgi:hypothetical protein